jgi:hypothetical protein
LHAHDDNPAVKLVNASAAFFFGDASQYAELFDCRPHGGHSYDQTGSLLLQRNGMDVCYFTLMYKVNRV